MAVLAAGVAEGRAELLRDSAEANGLVDNREKYRGEQVPDAGAVRGGYETDILELLRL